MCVFLTIFASRTFGDTPIVPLSESPDGRFHAIIDIDRDPQIVHEWKDDSYPQIEITEKETGELHSSITYFGAIQDESVLLREGIDILWRADSSAFAVTIRDRFYSSSKVFALNHNQNFTEVRFPTYKKMTGFSSPDNKHLRPTGRGSVTGWDKDSRLIYQIQFEPLPSFDGHDPLRHKLFLDVTAKGMDVAKVESDRGKWQDGHWVPAEVLSAP